MDVTEATNEERAKRGRLLIDTYRFHLGNTGSTTRPPGGMDDFTDAITDLLHAAAAESGDTPPMARSCAEDIAHRARGHYLAEACTHGGPDFYLPCEACAVEEEEAAASA